LLMFSKKMGIEESGDEGGNIEPSESEDQK
jgi:hypothetical protein